MYPSNIFPCQPIQNVPIKYNVVNPRTKHPHISYITYIYIYPYIGIIYIYIYIHMYFINLTVYNILSYIYPYIGMLYIYVFYKNTIYTILSYIYGVGRSSPLVHPIIYISIMYPQYIYIYIYIPIQHFPMSANPKCSHQI